MITCKCNEATCHLEEDIFRKERKALFDFLIKEKGYLPEEIKENVPMVIEVGPKRLYTQADIVVELSGKPAVVIRINEGSVVSRERGTIAFARLLFPEGPPPICVQTNGQEVSVLSTKNKKPLGQSLEAIPSREEMLNVLAKESTWSLSPKQIDAEKKILFFYDGVG
ncbi:type I restriction enzyme HsdR N-terminal domain-containing protein [Thermodesulfatator atlanticus]|uniref:type I restriction enzyme HsdR N-terminal domain-containing protein n=1 Tax=Thermodesulfatator atlanticus TaxID=501497 RepID=UPI0003B3EFE1|nr:type I restriction enzyme HsdR N-terminal domain-containing protein [Thermodesulfatator atlanticus]